MKRKFSVDFLEEAVDFLEKLDEKSRNKILYNIDKSAFHLDPKLFKKLSGEIWEFRTLFKKKQFRLFAFWVKSKGQNKLVIATHGMVKKTGKVDKKEIEKANKLRANYFLRIKK